MTDDFAKLSILLQGLKNQLEHMNLLSAYVSIFDDLSGVQVGVEELQRLGCDMYLEKRIECVDFPYTVYSIIDDVKLFTIVGDAELAIYFPELTKKVGVQA